MRRLEEDKMKYAVRVMTRSFVKDFMGELQNITGKRITTYEAMVRKGIEECLKELGNVDNFRIQISELTNGSMVIVVYGW